MTKPRVRIDREGWIRNDQPWPWSELKSIRFREADGYEVLNDWPSTFLQPDDTHYRIVG
jgi:hypothetical protein